MTRPVRTVVQLLHFHPHARRSMEVFLVSLAEELGRHGWRTVHVVSGAPGNYFREELERLGSPCIVAKLPLDFRGAWKLAQQLRTYQPEVINTTFLSKFSPSLWALKWLSGARYFFICDQTSGAASSKTGIRRWLARLRGLIAGRVTDKILAVSDFVRERDIRDVFLPAPKIRTVYNGVEIERFEGILRTAYDRFTIAFVGQLIPQKGVKTLIQASQELARDQNTPPFQLMIAGTGWQREALERYCIDSHLEHVHFLGQIDWAPGLMSSADVVVVPSEWEEACAFTILEAMACGACLVVSDAGGNRELIGEHLNAGLLFRKGDVQDLARHLSTLMRDAACRKQLAAAAKERAQRMFSMQRMVREHARAYSDI